MYYTESGDEFKKFNAQDGMGMKLLQQKGYKVGIITSEDRVINNFNEKPVYFISCMMLSARVPERNRLISYLEGKKKDLNFFYWNNSVR